MASPHVAGAALIYRQAYPQRSPAEVKAAIMQSAREISNQSVWNQGQGIVDLAAAIQRDAVITPASLSAGRVLTGSPIWVKSITCTLHNYANSGRTYALSNDNTSLPAGIMVQFPSAVFVGANQATTFDVTFSVDHSVAEYFQGEIPALTGRIQATPNLGDTIQVPYSLFYQNYVQITSDEYIQRVLIHDKGSFQEEHRINGTSKFIPLPAGTYDFVAKFSGPSDIGLQFGVFPDEVATEGSTVHLPFASVKNEVLLRTLDPSGNEIDASASGGAGVYYVPTGARLRTFVFSAGLGNNFPQLLSDLPAGYAYEKLMTGIPDAATSGTSHPIGFPFAVTNLTGNAVISPDLSKFVEITTDLNLPDIGPLARTSRLFSLGQGSILFTSLPGDSLTVDFPYVETVYRYTRPYESYSTLGWNLTRYAMFDAEGEFDRDRPVYTSSSYQSFDAQTLITYAGLFQHPTNPYETIPITNDLTLRFGYGTPAASVSMSHTLGSFSTGANFLDHHGGFLAEYVNIALRKNDVLAYTNRILNIRGYIEDSSVSLADGPYESVLDFPFEVAGRDALLTVENSVRSENSSYAALQKAEFRSGGTRTDSLSSSSANGFFAAVNYYASVTAVQIQGACVDNADWEDIPFTQNQQALQATIPSDLSADYYNLRVLVEDSIYGESRYTYEPAFVMDLIDLDPAGITSCPPEIVVNPCDFPPQAQDHYLKASNPNVGDGFGGSVAIDGNYLVVGAPHEAQYAGAAHVFERVGNQWNEVAYLKAANPSDGDVFGTSVDISGDTIAVGASQGANPNPGFVYVYQRDSSGIWQEQAILEGSGEGRGFGSSVALQDDQLLIGAPFQRLPGGPQTGLAYVFGRDPLGNWTELETLSPSNGDNGDIFGGSVALDGSVAVVGGQVLVGPWPLQANGSSSVRPAKTVSHLDHPPDTK